MKNRLLTSPLKSSCRHLILALVLTSFTASIALPARGATTPTEVEIPQAPQGFQPPCQMPGEARDVNGVCVPQEILNINPVQAPPEAFQPPCQMPGEARDVIFGVCLPQEILNINPVQAPPEAFQPPCQMPGEARDVNGVCVPQFSPTLKITCPSDQVVAPDGNYCVYPIKSEQSKITYRQECTISPVPISCFAKDVNIWDKNIQLGQISTFDQNTLQEVKILGSSVLDSSGMKIGELATSNSGKLFEIAPPAQKATIFPSTGGKKPTISTKKKVSTAPVILLNVTDAYGQEITDSNGKILTTAPVVKKGNFVFSDRNGLPIMSTPALNQSGKPVEHQGKILYTRLVSIAGQEPLTDVEGNAVMAMPLLDENGFPLLAKNGEILYAPPIFNSVGEVVLNERTNQLVFSTPMADDDGNAALGADKKPFMGQTILNSKNQVLTVAGKPVYTGAVGMPVTTANLQQIKSAQGQKLQFGFGGTLLDEGGNTILGPDGRPTILSVNATPLMANGLPLVDKRGKPCRVKNNGQVTDSSGRLILGPDGKPMTLGKWEEFEPLKVGVLKQVVKDPLGKTAVLGLNAQLFDSKGNPIFSKSGTSIYFSAKSRSLVDSNGTVIKIEKSGRISGTVARLAYQTVDFEV